MVLYTPRNSGDYTRWFYFQQTLINFFNDVPAIPPLTTVFGVKPKTKKLLNHSQKYTVHGIYTNTTDDVKTGKP